MIDAIAVVIPVNNEADLLPSCIAGVREAERYSRLAHPEVTVMVCFALDRCTDGSADITQAAGYLVIRPKAHGVGCARRDGTAAALRALGGFANHRIVIASTDADSVVPSNWLTHQIDLVNEGADVILGAVRPNDDDLDDERREAWERTHTFGQALGHVHGANLGIRADFYLEAGGFAPVLEHEDVDLVARAAACGATLRPTADHCVMTSGRLAGRTSGGYAGYLRDQLLPLAQLIPAEPSIV
jgi:Glycosyl transferase family 2